MHRYRIIRYFTISRSHDIGHIEVISKTSSIEFIVSLDFLWGFEFVVKLISRMNNFGYCFERSWYIFEFLISDYLRIIGIA